MAINFKKAGVHLGISFGIFLAGALVASIAFWGYATNLKDQARSIAADNAKLTSQISDLNRQSKDLTEQLSGANATIDRLTGRIGRLEEGYRRLKESIGSVISGIQGLDEELTVFGEELQRAVRQVLDLSEIR